MGGGTDLNRPSSRLRLFAVIRKSNKATAEFDINGFLAEGEAPGISLAAKFSAKV
jgi:hypothetical protein